MISLLWNMTQYTKTGWHYRPKQGFSTQWTLKCFLSVKWHSNIPQSLKVTCLQKNDSLLEFSALKQGKLVSSQPRLAEKSPSPSQGRVSVSMGTECGYMKGKYNAECLQIPKRRGHVHTKKKKCDSKRVWKAEKGEQTEVMWLDL